MTEILETAVLLAFVVAGVVLFFALLGKTISKSITEGLMSTQQGLVDLGAALTKMTAAVSGAATEIGNLASALAQANQASGDPDPAVEAIATSLSAQADALNAAVSAAPVPPAPVSTDTAKAK